MATCRVAAVASLLSLLQSSAVNAEQVAEALAADLAEEVAACDAGDETCEVSLSLRQLRGEVKTVGKHDQEPVVAMVEGCVAARQTCTDVMEYGSQSACTRETGVCEVQIREGGEPWLCVPVHPECRMEAAEHAEQSVAVADAAAAFDEDVEMDLGASYSVSYSAPREPHGTCRGRICHMYLQGSPCQCNADCEYFGTCCPDVRDHCTVTEVLTPVATLRLDNDGLFHGSANMDGHILTMYHTTSREVADLIVKEGFRPGKTGWCGGGIYFINTPILPKTKYAPGVTQSGAILEAKVQMGRMARMLHHCKGIGGGGVEGARSEGYNSIVFSQHDGPEWVIWDTQQVLSVKIYKYM